MLAIFGNSGFIGQHLTKMLDDLNIRWVGYDLKDGQDIRNKYQLDDFFEKNQVTEIIHLAALAGVRRSKKYPKDYIDTNILGTQNIVDLANEYEVKRIVFYSSSSVYGNVKELPVKEGVTKMNPISLYGITKLAGEQIVNNFEGESFIVRPFTVYGENGRKDEVVFRWLEQIKNNLPITVYDLESFRGYVYVKDLVEATIKLLQFNSDEDLIIKENFNLGGSEIVYLKDILKVFKEFFPDVKISYQDRQKEDVFAQYASTDKAKTILGFDPKPNFIENLKKILYEETKSISK